MSKKKAINVTEELMARKLDDLAEFEDFKKNLLPELQKDLKAGLGADALAAKYTTKALARVINISLTAESESVALAASKDVLDRALGQATKKVETTNFVALKDEEVDSLLATKLAEAGLELEDLEELQ